MQITSRFTIAVHVLTAIEYFKDMDRVNSEFLAGSVGVNPVIDIAIGRICGNRYCRLNDLQPLQHEIREQDGLFQRLFFWNIFQCVFN